eukprot:COSAG01_NODE_4_length_55812_cov_1344.168109_50_plen_265_part_00
MIHLVLCQRWGALHAGHLALVKQALTVSDVVIVSIFVNPTQFGPNEDFSSYPRDIEKDLALLAPLGVDAVFMPEVSVIYGHGFDLATRIIAPALAQYYCGASRPGFFDGVCGVVLRLFNLIRPTKAFFGEKDFQQLRVIQLMCQDLCMTIDIVGCAIVREKDGLAMSSRNQYLSVSERGYASAIYQLFQVLQAAFDLGERCVDDLQAKALAFFNQHGACMQVDYLAFVHSVTLEEVSECNLETRVLFAGVLGKTRLIDNWSFFK